MTAKHQAGMTAFASPKDISKVKNPGPKDPALGYPLEGVTRQQDPVSPASAQHSTISYLVVENMNSRTAEQGTAEYRSEQIFLFLSITSAVRNSLFVIRYSKYKGG